MYAIVDIETTGSHAADNGITEIAIVLHDGEKIEGRFSTLVNPLVAIPPYVVSLTGITNNMVATAPLFKDIAPNVHRLLQGRIFVAHNVNFDYSFIRHHLQAVGLHWQARKLCTLRLARAAFPGLPKYGLGHICRSLDIPVTDRHRATGDADATTILLEKIMVKGGEKLIKEFLKKEAKEQILPPNLPQDHVKSLPNTPGVYYFHDSKGTVIYVGKAKMLRKRVVSHFTGLDTGKKRQSFLRDIYSITFKETPTELTASILESVEIKRLWPVHNVSQKNAEKLFGIYLFEDGRGYLRLAIDKKRKLLEPLVSFNILSDAHRYLWKLVKDFQLDAACCFLDKSVKEISLTETPAEYNAKVQKAVLQMQEEKGTYAIIETCDTGNDVSCILVEKGRFFGMGLLPEKANPFEIEHIRGHMTPYPENEVLKNMLRSYSEKYPSRVLQLGA
ncbi:DNA polymerase-3 subunit epsilon [Filimonas lacunae]|uniref:DNA polymerase-3 subunit epsilon n=1 Tax=Filimonas lacunae TaxID=477680 RepID=A0A173MDY4_9BACT|nr:exonuclease domain-containing protein [Filimonas lacunae]BAV05706.1 DNA polymerase III epsilon subunit [Filimonas lacunae]SIT28837.1 DNA polymerase-3 subunit epsilon [Filimonas lacunae]